MNFILSGIPLLSFFPRSALQKAFCGTSVPRPRANADEAMTRVFSEAVLHRVSTYFGEGPVHPWCFGRLLQYCTGRG